VVVGVVGLAHVKGIKENWNADIKMESLIGQLPKRSSLRKALLILVTVLVLLFAVFISWLWS